jgi:hypothetical protein
MLRLRHALQPSREIGKVLCLLVHGHRQIEFSQILNALCEQSTCSEPGRAVVDLELVERIEESTGFRLESTILYFERSESFRCCLPERCTQIDLEQTEA